MFHSRLSLTQILLSLILYKLTQALLSPDDVIARLSNGGQIRGTIMTSENGKSFYAFRGIPYAEPPVGRLRFMPPVPKTTWDNESIFDATKDGKVCFQEDSFVRMDFIGEEDCLYLNVYTPQLPQNDTNLEKKSVMIFIHGGGFLLGEGTSTYYPPARLMDSDIVLVIMNYRLDALGFLSTGDASAPGNYGLLDQTLAFQWVQENIEGFGGNADSVTIFGQSAGAISVGYHLISPLSKGLFHRAIVMSGAGLACYSCTTNPLPWAKYLATQTGCPQTSTSEMINCFRGKPIKDLVLGLSPYKEFSSFPLPFVPTVDGYFLSATPREILTYFPEKINHVPVLIGATEMEGSSMVAVMKQLKHNVSMIDEESFNYLFNNCVSNQDAEIMQMIRNRYMKDFNASNEFETNKFVIKAIYDGMFYMNHYEEIKLLSKAGLDVYAYSYDFQTTNYFEAFGPVDRRYGVGHVEDLYVLFNLTWYGGIPFEERDFKMVDIMTNLWSNFAKKGNPDPSHKYIPEWKRSSPNLLHIHHLNLSVTVEDYDVANDTLFEFWTKDVPAVRNKTICQ